MRMRTKEITELSGVSKDTLRYYEELGLLKPNRAQYAREYSAADLERLEQIKQLKNLEFSLLEIKQWVDFDDKYETIEEIEAMSQQDQTAMLTLLEEKIHQISEKKNLLEQGLNKMTHMKDKLSQLKI